MYLPRIAGVKATNSAGKPHELACSKLPNPWPSRHRNGPRINALLKPHDCAGPIGSQGDSIAFVTRLNGYCKDQ